VPTTTLGTPVVEHGATCVLVLLPGLGDSPRQFEDSGFLSSVRSDPDGCDIQVVDAHFGYYREAVIAERMASVLRGLRQRYASVWLVGVSLGGYGAALTARAHPELVDGLVLISPFLGVPKAVRPVIARIEAAGGIDAFHSHVEALSRPQRHFVEVEPLWAWLARSLRDPSAPRIHLAWGADDGFAWKHRVLARSQGIGSALEAPGGHDWHTFSFLFRELSRRSPWKS
jgi:pimeloyl-ACP methyl ester carboxylesterase